MESQMESQLEKPQPSPPAPAAPPATPNKALIPFAVWVASRGLNRQTANAVRVHMGIKDGKVMVDPAEMSRGYDHMMDPNRDAGLYARKGA